MIRNHIVAVAGGIGCGKSVVCRMLSCMGYFVYDCDARARKIMDESAEIKSVIANRICSDAVSRDGKILRERLAEVVFANPAALAELNKCVHAAVREGVLRESAQHQLMFVETAILYQSELDKTVDSVWEVVAPTWLRIERVKKRNNVSEEAVLARIKAQELPHDTEMHPRTFIINNDDNEAVLPQLIQLINDELEIVGIHPRTKF